MILKFKMNLCLLIKRKNDEVREYEIFLRRQVTNLSFLCKHTKYTNLSNTNFINNYKNNLYSILNLKFLCKKKKKVNNK